MKMTEAKRIELASRKDRDAMYGPAFMGLPTRGGHLEIVPEVGDKFCAAGKPETVSEITAIAYDVRINACMITCKRSDGKEYTQPFGRLYDAIKASKAELLG